MISLAYIIVSIITLISAGVGVVIYKKSTNNTNNINDSENDKKITKEVIYRDILNYGENLLINDSLISSNGDWQLIILDTDVSVINKSDNYDVLIYKNFYEKKIESISISNTYKLQINFIEHTDISFNFYNEPFLYNELIDKLQISDNGELICYYEDIETQRFSIEQLQQRELHKNKISINEKLNVGDFLLSHNRDWVLKVDINSIYIQKLNTDIVNVLFDAVLSEIDYLMINDSGNIILKDIYDEIIWKIDAVGNNELIIENNGSIVLIDDLGDILWNSIDYLSDIENSILKVNDVLYLHEYILSYDKTFKLSVDIHDIILTDIIENTNISIFHNSNKIITSLTIRQDGYLCVIDNNNNCMKIWDIKCDKLFIDSNNLYIYSKYDIQKYINLQNKAYLYKYALYKDEKLNSRFCICSPNGKWYFSNNGGLFTILNLDENIVFKVCPDKLYDYLLLDENNIIMVNDENNSLNKTVDMNTYKKINKLIIDNNGMLVVLDDLDNIIWEYNYTNGNYLFNYVLSLDTEFNFGDWICSPNGKWYFSNDDGVFNISNLDENIVFNICPNGLYDYLFLATNSLNMVNIEDPILNRAINTDIYKTINTFIIDNNGMLNLLDNLGNILWEYDYTIGNYLLNYVLNLDTEFNFGDWICSPNGEWYLSNDDGYINIYNGFDTYFIISDICNNLFIDETSINIKHDMPEFNKQLEIVQPTDNKTINHLMIDNDGILHIIDDFNESIWEYNYTSGLLFISYLPLNVGLKYDYCIYSPNMQWKLYNDNGNILIENKDDSYYVASGLYDELYIDETSINVENYDMPDIINKLIIQTNNTNIKYLMIDDTGILHIINDLAESIWEYNVYNGLLFISKLEVNLKLKYDYCIFSPNMQWSLCNDNGKIIITDHNKDIDNIYFLHISKNTYDYLIFTNNQLQLINEKNPYINKTYNIPTDGGNKLNIDNNGILHIINNLHESIWSYNILEDKEIFYDSDTWAFLYRNAFIPHHPQLYSLNKTVIGKPGWGVGIVLYSTFGKYTNLIGNVLEKDIPNRSKNAITVLPSAYSSLEYNTMITSRDNDGNLLISTSHLPAYLRY